MASNLSDITQNQQKEPQEPRSVIALYEKLIQKKTPSKEDWGVLTQVEQDRLLPEVNKPQDNRDNKDNKGNKDNKDNKDKKNRKNKKDKKDKKDKKENERIKEFPWDRYNKLFPLVKLAYALEGNGTPEEHTRKLILTFGSSHHAIKYLKKFEISNPNIAHTTLVHDACLYDLPKGNYDIGLWQKLSIKFMPDKIFENILGRAEEIETYVKKLKKEAEDEINWKYNKAFGDEFDEHERSSSFVMTEDEYVQKRLSEKTIAANIKRAIKNEIHYFILDQMPAELKISKTEKNPSKEKIEKIKKFQEEYKQSEEGKQKLKSIQDNIKDEWIKKFKIEYQNKKFDYENKNTQDAANNTQDATSNIQDENKSNKDYNKNKQDYIDKKLNEDSVKRKIKAEKTKKMRSLLSETTSLKTLKGYLSKIRYPRASENLDASEVFGNENMSNKAFEFYLGLKPLDSSRIPPLLQSDSDIPILVEGKELGHPEEFYLTKLNPKDPRCAVLGKLTNCCQHFDGAGDTCACHGITSKEGGFYALCQRKKGRSHATLEDPIFAQCWAWRGTSDAMVFDSVESQINFRSEHHQLLVTDFFQSLANKLTTQYHVPRVVVGTGGVTPKNLGFMSYKATVPLDYSGYRDSEEQRVLSDKFIPFSEVSREVSEAYKEAKQSSEILSVSGKTKDKPSEIKDTQGHDLIERKSRDYELRSQAYKDFIESAREFFNSFGLPLNNLKYTDEGVKNTLNKICVIREFQNKCTERKRTVKEIIKMAKNEFHWPELISVPMLNGETLLRTTGGESELRTTGGESVFSTGDYDDLLALLNEGVFMTERDLERTLLAGLVRFKDLDKWTPSNKQRRLIEYDKQKNTDYATKLFQKNLDILDDEVRRASSSVYSTALYLLRYAKLGVGSGIRTRTHKLTALMVATRFPVKLNEDPVVLSGFLNNPATNEINAQDADGNTALMHAILWRNAKAIKVLLMAGADVNIKANDGYTALTLADEYYGTTHDITILLKKASASQVNAKQNQADAKQKQADTKQNQVDTKQN